MRTLTNVMWSTASRTSISAAWGVVLAILPVMAQSQTLPPRTLPACTKVGQQVTLTLNTGTGTGADPIWKIVQPTSITPFTTLPFNAPTLWLPNGLSAKWIQPAPGGTPANFPLNTYVYRTQFTTPVDPYLYTSITITGLGYAADDTAIVKLNGVPIASCPGGGTPLTWCFHSWKSIGSVGLSTFNRMGISPFLNVLEVQVKNTLANSPSGLLVSASVVAVCSKCTTPPPPPEPPCGGNPSTC